MATPYQNITPDKLSSTDGVLEMFQISADNHFEDIGLNVQRGASTWNYYMGSSPRNGIIKIDNATFLQAYNNPNVPQVLYTLTNGNKICLICDGGDYQICWLSPSNVRTNLSSGFYDGGYRDFLYDVQYWYSTNPQVSNKVYCSIIGWNSGRTIFKAISTFSSINLSAWTNLVNGAIPSADIIGTGGGATHIAKVTGTLATLENNLSDVLIVAGGGGGGLVTEGMPRIGENAGGISGSGNNSGNQSTGYAFGQGEANGGGGGLYGGYKAANGDSGGAGSGYIGNLLLDAKKMIGFNVPTSDVESTKTESVDISNPAPTANTPKAGNGFAKITWLRDLA